MPEQTSVRPVSTYNNGQPYRTARGHAAPQRAVVDHYSTVHPIITGLPSSSEFLRAVVRELKIRCYQPNTIKAYRNILRRFLKWFGNRPHKVTAEDVRDYLETLVDGGLRSDSISQTLAAIRTAFDKFCGRQVTLGLATPRKPKRVPVILSEAEVRRLLKAASSLRDKLLMGLMYATGMRISEVTRLQWRDFDFERGTVYVWQAKGRSDRIVTLPKSFAPLLHELANANEPDGYVFPGARVGKHMSSRTGERIVQRTRALAGIKKRVTPHSFRHAFATHLLEHGTDIRFIQKLLGHVRLETTTIYTAVAVQRTQSVTSPLDRIDGATSAEIPLPSAPRPRTGRLQIDLVRHDADQSQAVYSVEICSNASLQTVQLDPVIVAQHGPGWVSVQLPPDEQFAEQLSLMDAVCRDRVESPEFYRLLQDQLIARFSALPHS